MEKLIFEYSVLRYVPDVERGEYMNVGLMMMCKRRKWLRVRTSVDEKRLSSLRGAECSTLRHQLMAFEGGEIPSASLPVEERYRWMAAVKSAVIQCSPSHPGLIEGCGDAEVCLAETFDVLYRRLVE